MGPSIEDQLFGPDAETTEREASIYADETTKPEPPPYKEDGKPPPTKSRASGERIFGGLVLGAGHFLVKNRIDPPAGRCLQLEAPLAAKQIDKVIAGTWIDNLLQPLFRKSDDLEGLGAIFGLPVLVSLYWRKPELGPMLQGPIEDVLITTLESTIPLMAKEKRQKVKIARDFARISEAFEIPKGVDPIQFIFDSFIMQDVINQEAPFVEGE